MAGPLSTVQLPMPVKHLAGADRKRECGTARDHRVRSKSCNSVWETDSYEIDIASYRHILLESAKDARTLARSHTHRHEKNKNDTGIGHKQPQECLRNLQIQRR